MDKNIINKHPTNEMLINYAMGNSDEAEALIIAAHISYCKDCKKDVLEYEKLAGDFLFEQETLQVSPDLFSNILDSIDDIEQSGETINYVDTKINSSLSRTGIRIPSFVSKYLDAKFDTNDWKTTINNVRYCDLSFKDNNFKGKFLEIPPGKSMPKHGHEGYEATLVIHGGYSDESGHYNKGDLVIANDEQVHSPVASIEKGCLCLVVYSGSIKFKGLLGSILNLSKF